MWSARIDISYRSRRKAVEDESKRSVSFADHADIKEDVTHFLRWCEIHPRAAICQIAKHLYKLIQRDLNNKVFVHLDYYPELRCRRVPGLG